jgi:hypothetical protein
MKLSWTVFGALVAASLAATGTTLPAAGSVEGVPEHPTFTKEFCRFSRNRVRTVTGQDRCRSR